MIKKVPVSLCITMLFAFMSEITSETFSTLADYLMMDIDSSIPGVIIEVRTDKVWGYRGYNKLFRVVYEYTIDGVKYFGRRVSFDKPHENYEKKKDLYKVGEKITVYYDSSNPKRSVLEDTGLGKSVICVLLILGCTFLLFLFI